MIGTSSYIGLALMIALLGTLLAGIFEETGRTITFFIGDYL